MTGKGPRLAAIAAVVAVGACVRADPGNDGPLGVDFGDAVRANAALQVIDPRPARAGQGAPRLDGRRAAVVIERYETGTVLAPERVETTDTLDRRR